MKDKIQALWSAFGGCAVVLSPSGAMLVDCTGEKLVQTPRPKLVSGTAERDFESPEEALDALYRDVLAHLEERALVASQRIGMLGRVK